MIRLTEKAHKEALILKSEQEKPDLRVYLDGKGCDGFFYGVAFDERSADDHVFKQDGIDIVCDPESFKFVRDSVVDWVDDERGRGFLVENPHHRKFRGKFYKRDNWEERLI